MLTPPAVQDGGGATRGSVGGRRGRAICRTMSVPPPATRINRLQRPGRDAWGWGMSRRRRLCAREPCLHLLNPPAAMTSAAFRAMMGHRLRARGNGRIPIRAPFGPWGKSLRFGASACVLRRRIISFFPDEQAGVYPPSQTFRAGRAERYSPGAYGSPRNGTWAGQDPRPGGHMAPPIVVSGEIFRAKTRRGRACRPDTLHIAAGKGERGPGGAAVHRARGPGPRGPARRRGSVRSPCHFPMTKERS